MNAARQDRSKVLIYGTQEITATDIYALLLKGVVQDVSIIGADAARLVSEFEVLRDTITLPRDPVVREGSFDDAASAAVAIFVGGESSGGLSPSDAADPVAEIRSVAGKLMFAGFNGVLLIVREPVDTLVETTLETSLLPPKAVIGLGKAAGSPESRDRPGHVTWCTALSSQDIVHVDNCTADCPYFENLMQNPGVMSPSQDPARDVSPERLAACITQICEAVVTDSRAVIPVYTRTARGIKDRKTSASISRKPCVIGRNGIEDVLAVS